MKYTQNQLSKFQQLFQNNFQLNSSVQSNNYLNPIESYKKGYKIRIKKQNKGKFTEYCGGKVTDTCIQKGKNSSDPKIRKRATFAANARTWKHQRGGTIKTLQKIFSKLSSTKISPKEMRAFKDQVIKLTPQQIKQEAKEGARDIMMWYRSPQWETRAASRGLTKDEIKAFQNLQGRVLSQKLPMSNKFGPLNIIVEDMGKGTEGFSQFLPKSTHTNQYPSEHFIAISNQASHPYYTAIHEGMHHGTFNIGSHGWTTPQIPLSSIEQSALNKVLRNAEALNTRLEIDPNKFATLMNKLQTKYGMSELEARDWIGNRIKYWQNPQESRARSGAINQYKRNHQNTSEEELTQIDNARQIFTNESLNNLYGKTIALGIPVVLASSQLGNGE